ncbi:MAG TPA: phage/plasmid replication protein, II/X family [Cellvibrio sp.]|nr:phage/plasmid replication protein, II/X family [Cellvibrio sp.]
MIEAQKEYPGMIDWLTCRLDGALLAENVREEIKSNTSRILKIDASGNLEWEAAGREVIKSDSHQVVVRFGTHLEIMGSPARVSSGHNVFGKLDIVECWRDMIIFVQRHYGIIFPLKKDEWKITRIDVTQNYDMGSLENVYQAIEALKVSKAGRQEASPYAHGVIWGKGSKYYNGKGYAKGTDLRRNVKRGKAFCTEEQLVLADRILRLEYSIRRQRMDEIAGMGVKWWMLKPEWLVAEHAKYFDKFLSTLEVAEVDAIFEKIMSCVGEGPDKIKSHSQAQQAYDCYLRCKTVGRHKAMATYKRSTWYHHLKNLRLAGIKQIDLQLNNVVTLKARRLVLDQPVSCWADIKTAIGA